MAAPPNTVTVLDSYQVAPPPDSPTELSLPFLHFDLIWLRSQTQSIIFYELPCSKSHFLDTIIPRVKNSLSLSLKHFLPLAGNIVIPPANTPPFACYKAGDSLSLIVAQSSLDFLHLTDDQPRNADEFDNLIPHLPLPLDTNSSDSSISFPAAAIQITLFPNQGFCIGSTYQHAIADGASVVGFLHIWASISKLNGQTHHLTPKLLPFYNRDDGLVLQCSSDFWSKILMTSASSQPTTVPQGIFRATFVLREADIQKLKNFVRTRRPELAHISSFTIACAYLWICTVKLAACDNAIVDDEEPEYFICVADCRARMKPALPPTYFGNCLTLVKGETRHGALINGDGLLIAAETIGKSISDAAEPILDWNKACEDVLMQTRELAGKRALRIAGSPRFDVYAADYGWGRMKKYEHVSSGRHGYMSLCKSRDGSQGGIEIGVNMPKTEMDSFSAIFDDLLNGY